MQQNADYEQIANMLISTLPEFEELLESEVRIAYLSSDKEKKTAHKRILGQCIKVDETYKWTCPYDFMIVVYEPNVCDLNDRQIETLIRHELHHIGIEYADTGIKYYIVPHDIEDFRIIIDECGLDWSDAEWQGKVETQT